MTSEPDPAAPAAHVPPDGTPTQPRTRPRRGAEAAAALPISIVAAQLGLSQATLRMWQQRYGLAPTHTTRGGHRRYSPEDIERLQAVQRLTASGVSTGDAVRAVVAATHPDIATHPNMALPAHADPVAHRLYAAAGALDGPLASRLLRDHLAHTDPVTTWETVIRPVLGTVGDRWDQLPHGIAVEHLLSHTSMVILGDAAATPPAAAPKTAPQVPVLLACVPDEGHALPLTALAATLARTGVATTMLGAATPAATLAGAAIHPRGTVVVVLYAHLAEHADTTIFDHLPQTTPLIAAGPGWNPAQLPHTVPYVNNLATAAAATTTAVATTARTAALRARHHALSDPDPRWES